MKHTFKLATLSLFCANAFATPIYHPSGPNLTYGAVSNNQTIISNITNPAAGAAIFTKEDSQYRFGILSSIGAGIEFGQVDNFYDLIDQTNQKLTDVQSIDVNSLIDPLDIPGSSQRVANEINTVLIDEVNNTMKAIAADGYAKVFGSGELPIMPVVVSSRKLGGSFVFDANASVVGNMKFLSGDFTPLTGADVQQIVQDAATAGATNIDIDLSTFQNNESDSTAVVKGAAIGEFGFGYSRPVWEHEKGQLMAGARVKYYRVLLSQYTERLMDMANGSQSTFDSNTSDNYKESSGFGLDAGALWISEFYRAGAWLDNINKPSFKFNSIDAATLGNYTDATIISKLSKGTTYEMAPQVHLEGALYTSSQNWVIAAALDANAVKDPLGDEYQWLTLSAGYATNSWWIPGFRVGYRSNLAGSGLSYLTAGTTLFKSFTLDLAYGLDSVTIDGSTVPRSAMFNLGLELSF